MGRITTLSANMLYSYPLNHAVQTEIFFQIHTHRYSMVAIVNIYLINL